MHLSFICWCFSFSWLLPDDCEPALGEVRPSRHLPGFPEGLLSPRGLAQQGGGHWRGPQGKSELTVKYCG